MNVEYKQGMTNVFCDYDKVVVKNPTGRTHVEANVDQIFGVGEFFKLLEYKAVEDIPKSYRGEYVLISTYLPARAKKDLDAKMEESLPGIGAKDFMKEYFKNV